VAAQVRQATNAETAILPTGFSRAPSRIIRIGTFQYFAARGDMEAIERLSGYAIDRHFPEARDSDRPSLALLQIVVERQALLVARWMHVGFIHGVMNTDNTSAFGRNY
jgi:serine/tyrosine/threonine adenylyltransferase